MMLRALRTLFATRFNYDRCAQGPEVAKSTLRQSNAYSHHAVLIFVALGSAAFGVLLGSMLNFTHQPTYSNPIVPVHVVKSTFHYNSIFGASSLENSDSDRAWDALLPVGRGTVQYPAKSREFYTLSVTHQLHCLWGLRAALYSVQRMNDSADTHEFMHVRHCLDYLRQSLMCAADSTLEPVEPELKGVTGWAVERSCRSYADVKLWSERYRASNEVGFM